MIYVILLLAWTYQPENAEQYEAELELQVTAWLRDTGRNSDKRHDKAVEMIPIILRHCQRYNVDPLRVAILAQEENSWRQSRVGKAGEVGPLQVMPKWFKRFGLDTLDGQIEAGIWWISEGLKQCGGDGAQAFHWYRYSKCSDIPYPGARRRERLYKQAVKKYRQERISK